MPLMFMEGWDEFGSSVGLVTGNFDETGGTPTLNTSGGKFNGNHVGMNSTSDYIRIDHDNIFNGTNLVVGFHFKIDSLTQNDILEFVDNEDNTGRHSSLQINSDGSLEFIEGVLSPNSWSTSAGVITAGQWHVIELKIDPSTISGSFPNSDASLVIRVDGTTVLSQSSIRIRPADTGNPAPSGIGKTEFVGGGGVHRFDDIYILKSSGGSLNTDFVGDFRIEFLTPDGDSTPEQFQLSSGGSDSFSLVNEADPDDDATYISSQDASDTTLFTIIDATGTIGEVRGYGPLVYARRESGSTQNIQIQLKGATATVTLTSHELSTSYEWRGDVRDGSIDDSSVHPDETEVDNLIAGVKIPT